MAGPFVAILVIPAEAGIQVLSKAACWIPAFAGMTTLKELLTCSSRVPGTLAGSFARRDL